MLGLEDAVWGSESPEDFNLECYFNHCSDEEKILVARLCCPNPGVEFHLDVLALIRRIKSDCRRPKRELLVSPRSIDGAGILLDNQLELALELAARLMLLTCISNEVDGNRLDRNLFRPRWKDTESIVDYIDRIYPRLRSSPSDLTSIRVEKLAVGYLERFANVELVWVDQLSDHLLLLKLRHVKKLYVFRHPTFVKMSLEVLKAGRPELHCSTAEALTLGCLPPELLAETMATFGLLFPDPDDDLSQKILERERKKAGLDTAFGERFSLHYGDHQTAEDALAPEDVRGLYKRYPYWADRLYTLWKEADDPAPVTSIGRWTESKRNPRFTYWCTVVSLAIAISFGFVATLLAAIQIWIAVR